MTTTAFHIDSTHVPTCFFARSTFHARCSTCPGQIRRLNFDGCSWPPECRPSILNSWPLQVALSHLLLTSDVDGRMRSSTIAGASWKLTFDIDQSQDACFNVRRLQLHTYSATHSQNNTFTHIYLCTQHHADMRTQFLAPKTHTPNTTQTCAHVHAHLCACVLRTCTAATVPVHTRTVYAYQHVGAHARAIYTLSPVPACFFARLAFHAQCSTCPGQIHHLNFDSCSWPPECRPSMLNSWPLQVALPHSLLTSDVRWAHALLDDHKHELEACIRHQTLAGHMLRCSTFAAARVCTHTQTFMHPTLALSITRTCTLTILHP